MIMSFWAPALKSLAENGIPIGYFKIDNKFNFNNDEICKKAGQKSNALSRIVFLISVQLLSIQIKRKFAPCNMQRNYFTK